MDMSDMGNSSSSDSMGMEMGSGSEHACKISMMWNWNTIDACFISEQWHIRSKGEWTWASASVDACLYEVDVGLYECSRASTNVDVCLYEVDVCLCESDYAGSIVGIFFLVILVEWTRRASREYDRRIVREYEATVKGYEARASSVAAHDSTAKLDAGASVAPFRPTLVQQLIRSLFYVAQFGAGYMMMLLAMYYNGGIIFAIFAGAFFGHFTSSWDTVGHNEIVQKDCCC
ncbi:Ctr copper transporter family-domain-containing protein [Schizophyllum commune]